MNNKEEFDIYSVMKSKEISDYYRDNNIKLSPLEQECIIINSYNSLETQLELLQQLVKTVPEGDDKEKINSMVYLYEYVITLFYEPIKIYNKEHIIYSICTVEPNCNNSDELIGYFDDVIKDINYFYNIAELIEFMNKYGEERDSFSIELLLIPSNMSYPDLVQFICNKIDGKFVPFKFYFNEDFEKESVFSEALERYGKPVINRFMLPFEGRCRVKFQTPDMNEPFYGILCNKQEYNGIWYRFLYKDRENINDEDIDNEYALDMSYFYLTGFSSYAIFDWLESV